MISAEFEERAYEGPLYNQLERGERNLFTPGQVLESDIGFDRGIDVAEHAIWEILGYSVPPPGIALGYYDWPGWWVHRREAPRLPRFRINLFIQAKRPDFYQRRTRALIRLNKINPPVWGFGITEHQQRSLELLADMAGRRAHVTYAAPAFHTNLDLFRHTQKRTIVANSTFPTIQALKGHQAWFYSGPGAVGVANQDPKYIEELPLLSRLAEGARNLSEHTGQRPFEDIARDVVAAISTAEIPNVVEAQFLDDLQTFDRRIEPYDLRSTVRAYGQVRLFVLRFNLTWLIYT